MSSSKNPNAENDVMNAINGNPDSEYPHPQPPPPYPGLSGQANAQPSPMDPSARTRHPPPMGFAIPETGFSQQNPGQAGDLFTYVTARPPTVVGHVVLLRNRPTTITCPRCGKEVVTEVNAKATIRTHFFALLLCVVFWPCVCVPYCIDSCMNVEHYCPNCNAFVGTYEN